MLKHEIIAFFSAENFFRKKTEKAQKELFESLREAYEAEFCEPLTDDIYPILISYHNEQQKARKERQAKKLMQKASLPVAAGCDKATDHIKHLPKGRYVLTAAQNNTHINEIFLKCILNFCGKNSAQLLIGRITYNKNGFNQPDINAEDCELWYDGKIKPFLVKGHIDLQGVHFLSDSNVIPTATYPLTGFSGATGAGEHIVIPATKISLEIAAALKNSPTKTLVSTGAITKINLIMRKAGAVAAIEHCIGATYVDTTREIPVIRTLQLMPESDCFYDYDRVYFENGSARKINPGEIAALQPGDIHAEKMTEDNLKSIVKLIRELYPENLILHDVIDFSTCNHHNIKDCTFNHLQIVNNQTVSGDITKTAELIDNLIEEMGKKGNILVIESNHDLAINTWLKNSDFKIDQVNAVTYLKCMLALYEYQKRNGNSDDFNMLEFAYNAIGKGKNGLNQRLIFNRVDESCILAGVEMGCHGHTGTGGSKGTPKQFRKLGIPINTGHTHSPSIYGKVYTAGVSASLEMGYNVGASSWAIAHIVTYENGQRQILFT